MNYKEHFDTNGWIIIKNFFTPEEMKKIEEGVAESVKNKIAADLLCNSYLQDLTVLNPKIIKLVRELIGEDPTYIGDSSISINSLGMSLHKDNPDRAHAEAPDWTTPYSILRMGIYLQDYQQHSGGLILRDKSHNYLSRWKGDIINVKASPGDLVVWNLRTTHSGGAKRLKLFPGWSPNPYLFRYLPSFLFQPRHAQRQALFLSYGKDDHHMKRYVDYLMTREYAVVRWRNMVFTDDIRAKAVKNGLKLKELVNEAKARKSSDFHEEHVEIKF